MAAMCPSPADDDPTHALDDFVRRMRASTASQPSADVSINTRGNSGTGPAADNSTVISTSTNPPRKRPRWDTVDVVDVPTLDLRAVRQAAVHQAPDLAGPQPGWQPDADSLQLRHHADPRLLSHWQPGAWTGARRVVLPASTEFVTTPAGPVVETYPPQHLLLLWPPPALDTPLHGRWPQQVRLSAVPADSADQALLALVPADALLCLQRPTTTDDPIDWALAAEIVLHHDAALRPFQAQGLRDFIAAEREATFTRLNSSYQAAPGGAVARG